MYIYIYLYILWFVLLCDSVKWRMFSFISCKYLIEIIIQKHIKNHDYNSNTALQ